MALCTAITHTGARCASPAASDGNGDVCAHHARMARLMALAPKATSTASAGSPSSLSPPPQQQLQQPALELSVVQRSLAAAAAAVAQTSPSPAMTAASSRPSSRAPSSDSIASLSPTSAANHALAMLPGEGVLAAVSCSFQFPAAVALPALPGTLLITNYRLRFEPMNAALRSPGHFHRLLDDALVGIPRACVGKLAYPQAASATRSKFDSAVPTLLVVKFKDLRAWSLGGDIAALMLTLNRHVFVDSPLSLFAFATPNVSVAHQRGHELYDVFADFARMGVDLHNHASVRVTDVNRSYAMCPTYAPLLVVPAAVTDAEVQSVAAFRSKRRLPICSFVHARNGASIWRCAQPKRGILNAQSAADDRYLASLDSSTRQHQQAKRVWIADCRPELNARVNSLTGGGTESTNHAHATVSFLNIANIHAMRESLEAVRSLVATGNADLDFAWSARVEETKWLAHVRRVLSAALQVADAVENRATTVLVHCSDGWDRTGQLCALAQLLLDPHYRTIPGFCALVDKEWLRVGHKFHDRVGPGRSEHDEQSPVFLQFLDCVWQLLQQFPTHFEFSAALLETIGDALFAARFGTFVGNCDRERVGWRVATRTLSLWTHVLEHKAAFVNPFYRPALSQADRVLLPPVSAVLRSVTLWTAFYFRSATLPAFVVGNAVPPRFGTSATATAKTSHEDLEAAMAAALQRIQVLEDELRDARSSNSSRSVNSPSSSLSLAPQTVQSTPPVVLPPAPPAVSSTSTSSAFAAAQPSASLSSVSSSLSTSQQQQSLRPAMSTTMATWTCAICTKTNVHEALKCVVCGRPPPSV